jgi:hypothetical protein
MGKHRLQGRWAKPDSGTVVIFPNGLVGRSNGEAIGHVGRRVDTGEVWSAAEDLEFDLPRLHDGKVG